MTLVGDRQGIRLFFSADLAGSTALKNVEQENAVQKLATHWPIIFQQFFSEITDGFIKAADEAKSQYKQEAYPCNIHLWRMVGDEILFYSSPVSKYEHVQILCHAFVKTVEIYDKAFKQKGLGVKGTIWSAGFPIRNKLIRIDPKVAPYFWIDDLSDDPTLDTNKKNAIWHSEQVQADFLGPEIDLGFRLTSCTRPGRTVISLDTAVFIAKASIIEKCQTRSFHVGWKVLKGVFGEKPYPIIWIDTLKHNNPPKSRTSYEESESDFSKSYLSGKRLLSREKLLDLNECYFEDTKQYRLRVPYLRSTDATVPQGHKDIYKEKQC